MSIVGAFPSSIQNGMLEDAVQVMSLFAFIQSQVNVNAAVAGPLSASGITGAAASGANADITSLASLASVNGGPLAGLRNAIINGALSINQRVVSGAVTLAAGAYGHDRWKAGAGGCTYTFAASGNHTVITITAGSLMQVIEGVNVETATYVLSHQGTAQARIAVNGASTSGAYAAATTASPLAASPTGAQNVTVEFSTGTVDRVQFEMGSVATLFERRPYGLELSLCQRYLPAYNGASGAEDIATGIATTATSAVVFFPFKVLARAAVTGIVVSTPGNFSGTTAASGAPLTSITFGNGGASGARLSIASTSSSWTIGQALIMYASTVGAQILFTGCEL